MGWWNQWWSTIDWGNAPGWVGSILTSISVFLAVYILFINQRRETRKLADQFVTWAVKSHGWSKGIDRYQYWVHAHNTGDSPIPVAVLIEKRRGKNDYAILKVNDEWPLMPKATTKFVLRPDGDPEHLLFYVEFKDASGRSWCRDLETGNYVSERRVKNKRWRRYSGGLINRWKQFGKYRKEDRAFARMVPVADEHASKDGE